MPPLIYRGSYKKTENSRIYVPVGVINQKRVLEDVKRFKRDPQRPTPEVVVEEVVNKNVGFHDALLDTGASCSCISPKVSESLGLSIDDLDGGEKIGVAGGTTLAFRCEFSIQIGVYNKTCYGLVVPNLVPDVIVGMDVLCECLTIIDDGGGFSISC